jgi:hypothetical protein
MNNLDTIEHLPVGYRSNLVMIAMAKRWAAPDKELTVAERLRTLKSIKEMTFGVLTPEAVAVIEPANDKFEEIVAKAVRASIALDDDGRAMCKALEQMDVFANLLKLNPSLIRAAELCRGHG